MRENKKPENPNAFPNKWVHEGVNFKHTHYEKGMTLRDYFAAKAMQATNLEQYADTFGNKWAENVAKDSYQMADAMLKQREQ